MPKGLKEAFRLTDDAVERCYRNKPLKSDAERLEYLLNCIKDDPGRKGERHFVAVEIKTHK